VTDYYVNQSGTNGAATSLATGKTTYTAGKALLGPGDRLLINDGNYNEAVTGFPSGISDVSPTIIQAINRRAVRFYGLSANSYVSEIGNKNYVKFQGLVLDAAAANFAGIVYGDDPGGGGGAGSSYITIDDCEVKNATKYTGIAYHNSGATVKSHHIRVLNSYIHHCGTDYPTIDTFDGHGIYIVAYDSLFEGNTVTNIGNSNIGGAAIHQYFGGNGGLNRNIYRKNFIKDCYGAGFVLHDGTTGIRADTNIVKNCALLDEGAGGFGVSASGVLLSTNAVYASNGAAFYITGSATIQGNISWMNGAFLTNLGSVSKSNNLENDVDPRWVDPANDDFRLRADSPARDTGLDFSAYYQDDFYGNARV